MPKCRTMERNFCAGDKNAALFVDIDGTILECQPYFDEAEKLYAYYMALRGFDAKAAVARMKTIDRALAEKDGFERERYGRALVQCYEEMVVAAEAEHKKNKPRSRRALFQPQDIDYDKLILKGIGNSPFFRQPMVFPNAGPVLGRAHHSFLIFGVSIGNREAQKFKVRQANMGTTFDDLIITSRDDKAELVKSMIEDWNIDPHYSAFIGNSKRSDGACMAWTNFIYLPIEKGWEFDAASDLPQDSGFELFQVKDWRECEEKAINRLLRRRKARASHHKRTRSAAASAEAHSTSKPVSKE